MSDIKITNGLSNKLFRSMLTDSLNKISDFQVVEPPSKFEEIVKFFQYNHNDIIILDEKNISLGIDEKLKKLLTNSKILFLFTDQNIVYIQHLLKCGINGFIHSNCSMSELEHCIRVLNKNHRYVTSELADSIIFDNKQSGFSSLTDREIQILKMLTLEGMALVHIAKTLKLSPKTITAHKANIMNKLASKNNAHLINQASSYFGKFSATEDKHYGADGETRTRTTFVTTPSR